MPSLAGEPSLDLNELLGDAVERAVVVARRDHDSPGAAPPPQAIRPVLRFTRLPGRAMQVVRSVLDDDAEFRRHVAEGLREGDVDRASWLFLTRPKGWRDELDLIEAAAREEHADEVAGREAAAATRRAAQLEEQLLRVRDELEEAKAAAADAEELAGVERRARLDLQRSVDRLAARVEELDAGRARAVKELKRTEALAADRLETLRGAHGRIEELERDVADAGTMVPGSAAAGGPVTSTLPEADRQDVRGAHPRWSGVDRVTLAGVVAESAGAAAALAGSLRLAASLLGDGEGQGPAGREADVGTDGQVDGQADRQADGQADGQASAGSTHGVGEVTARSRGRSGRPTRRSPVRLQRGVRDDSAEAVEQLLDIEDLVALVDGYNVTMERWPTLDRTSQRTSLIQALGGLASRHRAEVHVVFDGDDDGSRPAVGVPLPVRVHFSPSEVEADDQILAMVAAFPTDRPVLVVSTDRRVAEGARRLGANAVRSSQLIEVLAR